MRICESVQEQMWSPLEAYKAGTPVRFRTAPHDKHRQMDLFIVNAVCGSYRPEDRKYRGKICVSNLRTGEIAYIDKDRQCTSIAAVVQIDGECS